jgi:hypothetical protein
MNTNIYKYINLSKFTNEEFNNLNLQQKKVITHHTFYKLTDNLNNSFDFINHENLKNCYLHKEEEIKDRTLREKQFIKRQNIFEDLEKSYNYYKHYLEKEKENNKDALKELFKSFYNSNITHYKLTNELYEDYYFKLNTIYFKHEIEYNYKTLAEFFLKLTEYNNENGCTFYKLLEVMTNYNIEYDTDIIKKTECKIDLSITEDKGEADLYQDNKSYGTAHIILDLINAYDKLPTKLKTYYKKWAELYNIKPLYNKNYFLNKLENKFYYISFPLRKINRLSDINELYKLYPQYETTELIYEQDPSYYEPKPKISKLDKLINVSYFHNFNYRKEYEQLLLGH